VRGGGGGTECRVGRGRRLCETGHRKTGGPWAATVGGRIRLGKIDAEFLDARCATKWENQLKNQTRTRYRGGAWLDSGME
jgi:hypothetical protein